MVDDGSPDNCPCICDNWGKKDKRIRVVHKKNGGLSDARNAGMRIASGEYIAFVDSDDWIDLETYSLVMEKIFLTKSQIGVFNIIEVTSSNFVPDLSQDYIVLDSEKAIENTIDDVGVKTVAWNKVYNRSILEGLLFPKGKLHEDEFFTYRAIDRAEKIVYLQRQCYYYYQRKESIMGSFNIRHLDMLDGVKGRMEFVEKKYPSLYSKAKLSFSSCCMFQYQELLNHIEVDSKSLYRNKIKQLRRSVVVCKDDVKDIDKKSAIFHRVSNSPFGLDFICRIKNILHS